MADQYSPHASAVRCLYFQSDNSFAVPLSFLEAYKKLVARTKHINMGNYSEHKIILKYYPDDVGHVVVHYLYTGSYQCLACPDNDKESIRQVKDLTRSLQVQKFAQEFGIPGLEHLSINMVDRQASKLEPHIVLQTAVKLDFKLPVDGPWLQGFLEDKLGRLFEDPQQPDPDNYSGIFGREGDCGIGKFLISAVMKIFCAKMVLLTPSTSVAGTEMPLEEDDSTTDAPMAVDTLSAEKDGELAPADDPLPTPFEDEAARGRRSREGALGTGGVGTHSCRGRRVCSSVEGGQVTQG